MPRYTINATLYVPASISVEAENEDAALDDAASLGASFFDYDIHSADVEFNVEPMVEEEGA